MTHTASNEPITFAGMAGDLLGRPDHRPPLVLLPGLSFDRRIWRPVLEHLDEIDPGRQILSLDLPGHGESPQQPPHGYDHVVELVREAIEQAGLSRPVLVGHSMAGGIASMYAARHPVSGVVNVDAAPVLAPFVRLIQSMIDPETGQGVAAAWAVMEQSFRTDLLPREMRLLVAENSHPDAQLVLGYWRDLLQADPALIDEGIGAEIAAVAARRVPYVLVLGTQPPPAVQEQLVHMLGGSATVEVWDGSGHFPQLAHPARFAQLLAGTNAWADAVPSSTHS